MIVDCHTHVHPPAEQARAVWKGRCPATIENVLALHDEVGLDISVISSAAHYLRNLSRDEAVAALSASNRYLASLRDSHKGKIIAMATSIPGGGDTHLRELERAVKQDDLRGVLISSSHRGAYPDDDDARPFFALACELDIPVFVHPPAVGFGEERMDVYRLASSVGRPFDNCLALARMIVSGILEEFPNLKLVGTHLGGGICEIIGRLDYAYELGDEAYFLGTYEPMKIMKKPSEYLKQMYLDTTCYHTPALECAAATLGADRLLLGSDAPMLNAMKRRSLQIVEEARLSDTEKESILGGLACKLFKL
ncbi:MAG: amidohydrolase family protein [Beijerinckiaceae bacterium]